MTERNPYETPQTEGSRIDESRPALKRQLYVHSVALIGSLLAFVGGFGAAFIIPTMVSQQLASSRQWVTILLVLGVVVGLVCAVLSYRGTLRTYAK